MSHDETKLFSAAYALQIHQTASRGTRNFEMRDLEFSQMYFWPARLLVCSRRFET